MSHPMTEKIYKYSFGTAIAKEKTLLLPVGAKFLSVQMQNDTQICFWAIVDVEAPLAERHFRIYATGELVQRSEGKLQFSHCLKSQYLGTVQDKSGCVWHVFEQL